MSSLSRELVFLILQFLDEEKFKETVHKHDRSKAVDILVKDLKVFATFNEELFKEITQLLTLENFRIQFYLFKWLSLSFTFKVILRFRICNLLKDQHAMM
ncbi:hypothetical protein L1049_003961 [Liquidambar formosana]|uniref:TPR1-like CTLH-containing domain-containing protein n=1 Tax=Liquidambar formosana TaxID=63359 RepID=A0AAP0RNR3_LIQFO